MAAGPALALAVGAAAIGIPSFTSVGLAAVAAGMVALALPLPAAAGLGVPLVVVADPASSDAQATEPAKTAKTASLKRFTIKNLLASAATRRGEPTMIATPIEGCMRACTGAFEAQTGQP
jgi:hypothetical protein